jgi:hypothetical protein
MSRDVSFHVDPQSSHFTHRHPGTGRRAGRGTTSRWTDNPSSFGSSESIGFDSDFWFGIVLGLRFGVCQLIVLATMNPRDFAKDRLSYLRDDGVP